MSRRKTGPAPDWREPINVRFQNRVNKDGPTPIHKPELGPCYVWTGCVSVGSGSKRDNPSTGYGCFYDGERLWPAHRWLYQQVHGLIPHKHYVCHHCDNPICVRESHLFLGTALDNNRDRINKRRTTRKCVKLNPTQKEELIRLHEEGWSGRACARHFGVNSETARYIINKHREKQSA